MSPPVPASAISSFVEPEHLRKLLAPLVPDPHALDFLLRCIIDEGPAHHRGANFVILALLGELLKTLGVTPAVPSGAAVPVPIRLPPHLSALAQQPAYPLPLFTVALERLAPAGSERLAAMIDCLTDGPPQHALANAAMVALLTAALGDGRGQKG